MTDSTARAAAERPFAPLDAGLLFAMFMQNLPGLAWIKDAEGRYVYANAAALDVFGTTRERLYARTDDEIFPAATAGQFRANDERALASGTRIETVETLEHADGVHHSLVIKFPIRAPGGALYVGGVAIDMTDRVKMEEALRAADRRKDQFLATLSHELRNPLAPLSNVLHLLEQGHVDPDRARLHQIMRRQLELVMRMVEDLSDASRIAQGRIVLRRGPVDLAEVIATAIETSRPRIDAARHRLCVDLPDAALRVHGDAQRLTQVLANLLNNAAKFTPAGGVIRLHARCADDRAEIAVTDSGIGISPDLLPRLFELFAADGEDARAHGGLGIGLALAKHLVESHGGTLEARSDGPGTGSTFVVSLPRVEAVARPGDAPHAPCRVLVVDDNRDAADTLANLLTLLGHEVRTAYDGPGALEALATFVPEIALIDISMPGMSGYTLAGRLRERCGTPLTIAALTGHGQEDDRRRSLEAGIDAHFVKPVPLEELVSVIAMARAAGRS